MWVLFLYTRILFNVLNFKTWRQSSLGTFTYNNELNLTVWHIGCFQTKCRQYIYCIYISLEYRGKNTGKTWSLQPGETMLRTKPQHLQHGQWILLNHFSPFPSKNSYTREKTVPLKPIISTAPKLMGHTHSLLKNNVPATL